MKILLIAIFAFCLAGCEATERQAPTPFETSEKTLRLQGCEKLHKDVKEWNKLNPTMEPRIADC